MNAYHLNSLVSARTPSMLSFNFLFFLTSQYSLMYPDSFNKVIYRLIQNHHQVLVGDITKTPCDDSQEDNRSLCQNRRVTLVKSSFLKCPCHACQRSFGTPTLGHVFGNGVFFFLISSQVDDNPRSLTSAPKLELHSVCMSRDYAHLATISDTGQLWRCSRQFACPPGFEEKEYNVVWAIN